MVFLREERRRLSYITSSILVSLILLLAAAECRNIADSKIAFVHLWGENAIIPSPDQKLVICNVYLNGEFCSLALDLEKNTVSRFVHFPSMYAQFIPNSPWVYVVGRKKPQGETQIAIKHRVTKEVIPVTLPAGVVPFPVQWIQPDRALVFVEHPEKKFGAGRFNLAIIYLNPKTMKVQKLQELENTYVYMPMPLTFREGTIFYFKNYTDGSDLYQRKLFEQKELQLTDGLKLTSFTLSPDGKLLLLKAESANTLYGTLYLLSIESAESDEKPKILLQNVLLNPVWLPDNRRFLVTLCDESGSFDIWLYDLSKGNKKRLTTTGDAYCPVYLNDTTVLFIRNHNQTQNLVNRFSLREPSESLWRMDLKGNNQTLLIGRSLSSD